MGWRELCEKTIRESHTFPKKHTSHQHLAIILLRKKVLATATNKIGTRSTGSGHNEYMVHAEIAVIKKLGDVSKLKGATLVVLRLGSGGQFLSSKPCTACHACLTKCIDTYGLRSIVHS